MIARHVFALALTWASGASVYAAGEGADSLLKALNISNPSPTAGGQVAQPSMVDQGELKLDNAIARQLFSEWNAQKSPPFEINAWVKNFFNNRYEPFAHLWGALETKLPEAMLESTRAAFLYSLYKLNLTQTFFNEWMRLISIESFAQSRGAAALEEALAGGFEGWYFAHAIQISPEQKALIQKLGMNRSAVWLSLNAAVSQRTGELAAEILTKLPINSGFRPLLAQTLAVGLTRKEDLASAAKVLKVYYEPWLATVKEPRKLALHYMQIARLLYQAGSLEGAIQYYQKVPNGIPEYVMAREELAWCWLRLGDIERLRGNLSTLTSKLLADQFQPEAYLVRSITNLKLCYYQEVEKDFRDFLNQNASWAKSIDQAVKAPDPGAPRTLDHFSEVAVRSETERAAELTTLTQLSDRSISAVLPAVGPQKHWVDFSLQIKQDLEVAKKTRAGEFRRQWKNDQITLQEAIRKMRFVKVELLSQLATLASASADTQRDQIQVSAAHAQSASSQLASAAEADMVFPFDGVIWSDELFKLRARTKGSCLGQN